MNRVLAYGYEIIVALPRAGMLVICIQTTPINSKPLDFPQEMPQATEMHQTSLGPAPFKCESMRVSHLIYTEKPL